MLHADLTKSFIIKPFLAFTLLILFIILNLSSRVQAQGPVMLTDEQDEYPLGLHLEILEDPTRQLTINEVASPEFDRNQTLESNFCISLLVAKHWPKKYVRC